MITSKSQEIIDFWENQRHERGTEDADFHAYTFAEPRFATYHDELLVLVSEGLKRATAHLSIDFDQNDLPRRKVGDYWVVLSTQLKPRYLIRITDIDIRPFNLVEQSFAEREGEGDKSLAYWRKVHQEYFELQCKEWGIRFDENMPTVCEGFELISSSPE